LLKVGRRDRLPLLGCYVQVSDFGSVVGLLAAEVMARYQVLRDPDDVGRSTGGEEGGGDV